MKVLVLRSFAGKFEGVSHVHSEGDEFDMPDGTDWIKAGLVKPVRGASTKSTTPNPEPDPEPPAPKKARGLGKWHTRI